MYHVHHTSLTNRNPNPLQWTSISKFNFIACFNFIAWYFIQFYSLFYYMFLTFLGIRVFNLILLKSILLFYCFIYVFGFYCIDLKEILLLLMIDKSKHCHVQ
jgi:hypothetical protein